MSGTKTTQLIGPFRLPQVVGLAIAVVGEKAEPVLALFSALKSIMMKITQWVINFAPIGILFLVGSTAASHS